MLFDPLKCEFQVVDQHCTEQKRDAQAEGVGQQHQDAFQHMALLGGQHQGGPQEGPHTRRPANGKDDAKQQGREKAHSARLYRPAAAAEQADLKHSQVAQPEEDDHKARDEVDRRLMRPEKASHRACQRAQRHKNQGKPGDEA